MTFYFLFYQFFSVTRCLCSFSWWRVLPVLIFTTKVMSTKSLTSLFLACCFQKSYAKLCQVAPRQWPHPSHVASCRWSADAFCMTSFGIWMDLAHWLVMSPLLHNGNFPALNRFSQGSTRDPHPASSLSPSSTASSCTRD